MTISPLAGVDLSQLAAAYQQQVTSGSGGAGGLDGTDAAGRLTASGQVDAGTAARGADFAGVIGQSVQQLENLDKTASVKAISAATGDLTNIHDYVIAATEAQTATELTTTVRNKALDAFNEIMRMPL